MPTNLTESATFTASVPVLDNGDALDEAGLQNMAQPLANRTQWLKERVLEAGVYRVPLVGSGMIARAVDGTWEATNGGTGFHGNAGSDVYCDLGFRLPPHAVITQVLMRFMGDMAALGSHGSLPANMPTFSLYEDSTLIDTETDASGSVGAYDVEHDVTMSGLSLTVDADKRYRLYVVAESGANSQNSFGFRTYAEVTLAES